MSCIPNSDMLVERPQALNIYYGAGEKGDLCSSGFLLGLPCVEFQGDTAVSQNMAWFCDLLEEIPLNGRRTMEVVQPNFIITLIPATCSGEYSLVDNCYC